MPVEEELEADDSEPSSRALAPTESGFAETAGVRVGYELFGQAAETVLLLPPWSIVHSRVWKLQVPYLARHFRVLTFDARGNGRSDRPPPPSSTGRATSPPTRGGARRDRHLRLRPRRASAAPRPPRCCLPTSHPERVRGALFMTPALPITPPLPERTGHSFDADLPAHEGWAKYQPPLWARDFRGYLAFFFDRCFTEPHSTKQFEDSMAWALETDARDARHGPSTRPTSTPPSSTCCSAACAARRS